MPRINGDPHRPSRAGFQSQVLGLLDVSSLWREDAH
jgi:hypothetical protein